MDIRDLDRQIDEHQRAIAELTALRESILARIEAEANEKIAARGLDVCLTEDYHFTALEQRIAQAENVILGRTPLIPYTQNVSQRNLDL